MLFSINTHLVFDIGFPYFVDVKHYVEEAIFHDLNLNWYNRYRKVMCETDSATTIHLLSHANVHFHPLAALINHMRD